MRWLFPLLFAAAPALAEHDTDTREELLREGAWVASIAKQHDGNYVCEASTFSPQGGFRVTVDSSLVYEVQTLLVNYQSDATTATVSVFIDDNHWMFENTRVHTFVGSNAPNLFLLFTFEISDEGRLRARDLLNDLAGGSQILIPTSREGNAVPFSLAGSRKAIERFDFCLLDLLGDVY